MGAPESRVREILGNVPDFSSPVLVASPFPHIRITLAGDMVKIIAKSEGANLKNPDVICVPASASISQIREAVGIMRLAPSLLPYRIGILEDMGGLSEGAQDVLLKDFEESAKRSRWIGFSSSFLDVSAAIRSRCHCHFAHASEGSPIAGGPEEASLSAALRSISSPRNALELSEIWSRSQDEVREGAWEDGFSWPNPPWPLPEGRMARMQSRSAAFARLSSLLFLCSRSLKQLDGALEGVPELPLPRQRLMEWAEEIKKGFDKISANVPPRLVFDGLLCKFFSMEFPKK